MLCYDITNAESFQNLEDWQRLARRSAGDGPEPLMALVGNKCDLSHMRAVRTNSAHAFADEVWTIYMKIFRFESFKILCPGFSLP